MNRRAIRIFFAIGFVLISLFGCDEKSSDGFKPNRAELGQDWSQFKHDTSFNVWVFRDEDGYATRPQEHQKPGGARVFWNGEVTNEEHELINSGLSEMLSMCRPKFAFWLGKDVFSALYFNKVTDYKVIFVKSNYTLQEGEARGCAGMITGAGGVITAAGTVGGLNDRVGNSTPGGKGGVYIIVPKQTPGQLSNSACKNLMKNAVRNEAEHVILSNVPQLYFAYGNDGVNGNHPYCAQ